MAIFCYERQLTIKDCELAQADYDNFNGKGCGGIDARYYPMRFPNGTEQKAKCLKAKGKECEFFRLVDRPALCETCRQNPAVAAGYPEPSAIRQSATILSGSGPEERNASRPKATILQDVQKKTPNTGIEQGPEQMAKNGADMNIFLGTWPRGGHGLARHFCARMTRRT